MSVVDGVIIGCCCPDMFGRLRDACVHTFQSHSFQVDCKAADTHQPTVAHTLQAMQQYLLGCLTTNF